MKRLIGLFMCLILLLITSCISFNNLSDDEIDAVSTHIVSYVGLTDVNAETFKTAFKDFYKENLISFSYDSLEHKYFISPYYSADAQVYFGVNSKGNVWNRLRGSYNGSDWLFVDKVVFYGNDEKWMKDGLYWSIKSDVSSTSYSVTVYEEYDVLITNNELPKLLKITNGSECVIRTYGTYGNFVSQILSDKQTKAQYSVLLLESLLLAK